MADAVMFPQTAGSVAVEQLKGKELAREIKFVAEVKNTSGDPLDLKKDLAAFIDTIQKLIMDNAKLFSDPDIKFRLSILKDGKVIDEIQGKAAALVDEIQTEKMDKPRVEAVEVQTEKMDKAPVDGEDEEAETGWGAVSVGANGKYRLPDAFVRSILSLPRLPSLEDMDYFQTPNLAELLGVTEESLEEDRKVLREEAAHSKRINDNFVLHQDKFREEWERQGYVEVDEEYITNMIKRQELANALWKGQDWSDFQYPDPDNEGDQEGLCILKFE